MQASMSRSFFVIADHIGLLAPLGSIKPVAPSAPCVIFSQEATNQTSNLLPSTRSCTLLHMSECSSARESMNSCAYYAGKLGSSQHI